MQELDIWSRLRGIFNDELTFSQIKNVAGSAGLPVSRLAHLVQKSLPQRSATKDELMSGLDGLVEELTPKEQRDFVSDFTREALTRRPSMRSRLEEALKRIGCAIESDDTVAQRGLVGSRLKIEPTTTKMSPIIFISHSSRDIEVGDALLRLLKDAFGLRSSEIRFTSHPAYG